MLKYNYNVMKSKKVKVISNILICDLLVNIFEIL